MVYARKCGTGARSATEIHVLEQVKRSFLSIHSNSCRNLSHEQGQLTDRLSPLLHTPVQAYAIRGETFLVAIHFLAPQRTASPQTGGVIVSMTGVLDIGGASKIKVSGTYIAFSPQFA